MDLRQMENIIAIEHEQSISRAAEKLFLTQSALNQQLLKLEKELGTPLFERRKHSMIPTFAGRIYLASARQIMEIKQETYKIIHDISEETSGEIAVSYTPETGATMFTHIYPLFHKRYPKITFRIHEQRIKKMEQLLLKREVALAFVAYYDEVKNPDLEYMGFSSEKMVLGVPASHPVAALAGKDSYQTLPLLDLKLLRGEKFVLPNRETRIRDMIDQAFLCAGFHPQILFESASTRTVFSMVKQQIGCSFFPQSYVDPQAPIAYFTFQPLQIWMRGMAILKGNYITKPEKYFIALAIDYTRGLLKKSLDHQSPALPHAKAPSYTP